MSLFIINYEHITNFTNFIIIIVPKFELYMHNNGNFNDFEQGYKIINVHMIYHDEGTYLGGPTN